MKRFALAYLMAVLMLSGCTTNYYLTVSDTETPIYSTADGYDQRKVIEAGKAFVHDGKLKSQELLHRVTTKFGSTSGYSPSIATWKPLKKLSKKKLEMLTFTSDYGYTCDGIPTSSYRYGRLAANSLSYKPSSTYGSGSTKPQNQLAEQYK